MPLWLACHSYFAEFASGWGQATCLRGKQQVGFGWLGCAGALFTAISCARVYVCLLMGIFWKVFRFSVSVVQQARDGVAASTALNPMHRDAVTYASPVFNCPLFAPP